MGISEQRNKSAEMAKYMKANPGMFPDSVRRPHRGCGRDDVIAAQKLGTAWKSMPASSTWERGMLGGVLAARLGYGTSHVPEELLE